MSRQAPSRVETAGSQKPHLVLAASKSRVVVSDDDDSDYDAPLSSFAKGASAPAPAPAKDDDDEDVLLASLAKAPKPKPAKKPKAPAVGGAKRPRKPDDAGGDAKKPRATTKRAPGEPRKLDKSQPLKPQAVEAILVRWQYVPELAAEWPPMKAAAYPVGPGFKPMAGFPGVFVGVGESEHLGQVLDMRPVKPCPSKAYLMTLPSETLAHYWTVALQGQLEALVGADGEGARETPLGKALVTELHSAAKFLRLAAKADAQAVVEVAQYKAALKAERKRRKAVAMRLLGVETPQTSGPAPPAAEQ